MTATTAVWVPSPVRHHSFRFELGNERRHGGNYYFSSRMAFSRGYDSVAGSTLWRASVNYALPLCYPDFVLSQLAYLNRVTLNFFYDYGRTDSRLYRSAGVEAWFDLHAFSLDRSIRVGVRYAYRVDGEGARIEPVIAFQW